MEVLCTMLLWALSSAGSERTPHTRKVAGSIPAAPTKNPDETIIGILLVVTGSPYRMSTIFLVM